MVFVKSSTIGCYKMEIKTPKRFKEDKKSLKYKEWKNKQDKKYDDKVIEFKKEKWWNSKTPEEQEELLEMYGDEEIAKKRMLRFSGNMFSCKSFTVLNLK